MSTTYQPIGDSEDDIRYMRAKVFGECTDTNWEACRDRWMRADSIVWLHNQCRRIDARNIEKKSCV